MGPVILDDLQESRLADGITARAVHAGTVTVMLVKFEEGTLVPEHSHHNGHNNRKMLIFSLY